MATIGLNDPEYVSLSYQSFTNAFRALQVNKCAIVACEAAAAGLRTSQCFLHTCVLNAGHQRKHSACASPAVAYSTEMRASCTIYYTHHTPAAITAQPNLCPAPGVEDTGQASTPTQQQPSTVGGSVTSGEGTSLQSSPSLVPPARLGAALHRQRLVSSQPEGSEESGSVSSNSSHLVPARFQAGQSSIR